MLQEQQDQHSSQWAVIQSTSAKVGCTAETLRKWVKQAEIDQGKRDGLNSSDRERLKEQASLRSRDALWDIQVPKTHSIFDSLFMPRPPCVRCLAIRPFVSHPKTTTANG